MRHRIWCLCFYLLVTLVLVTSTSAESGSSTCESSREGECNAKSEKSIHTVSREELETKNGEGGSEIWLSVMGKVYDVTAGDSFYGKGMSYGAFSATDCTVCFVTGVFSPEEAAKHPDVLSDTMLPGVLEWVTFYETHDLYKFVGYLVDPRYYDENGDPTNSLIALRKRISKLQN
mmetsp:Transcript_26743/g.62509  ORF Transcript_26743/g.62509 Transcript_26743/m.62509 type:complete len:175 (-) Transcript_26743:126-650(-)|eukprot:CAMPEP_0172399908 /NCGR_PEP_ID=MMETSP1061-20121228/43131_1 /TAXON_ID=37318 /ORGANISM="Pseudo-nitzschia pungens, Strain cf. pungens" /LENGTH=174 /DNA_ID=CAMNT_0013132931 /DNA_START=49 /DNA_END=573 /DNA_ORIENTATION=+